MTMLATVEVVVEAFKGRTTTDLDWSAAVIGLCKGVELEVVRLIAMPLRQSTAAVDLSADKSVKAFRHMYEFCVKSQPITMGQVAFFLNALNEAPDSDSPLVRAARLLGSQWPRSDWLFAQSGLADSLRTLTREHRNPAAHTGVLSRVDYQLCMNRVSGTNGILLRLIDAVEPVQRTSRRR
jgi:hypothetical protein